MGSRALASAAVIVCLSGPGAPCLSAQQAPPSLSRSIYTDPPRDSAHPARMEVLHIPSGGVRIDGVAYLPPGPGPHPTFILPHGRPGNEKNLDLAQAVRRAGWNPFTFNFRGSWGSPGTFSFAHCLEDADAALAYLRRPATLRARGPGYAGTDGRAGAGVHGVAGGVTAESMVDELTVHADAFSWFRAWPFSSIARTERVPPRARRHDCLARGAVLTSEPLPRRTSDCAADHVQPPMAHLARRRADVRRARLRAGAGHRSRAPAAGDG